MDTNISKKLNILQDNCFYFQVASLPTLSMFLQSANIPGIDLGRSQIGTSNVNYDVPGDKIEFEDLSITFILDENFQAYIEIFNWICALGFPRSSEQFKIMKERKTPFVEKSDLLLTITTNKYNPSIRVHYVDAFPVNISGVDFMETGVTVSQILVNVMFSYSYFYFEPIEKN